MLQKVKKITSKITNQAVLDKINFLDHKVASLEQKIDELLFVADAVKNSRTIPVGPTEAITTIFTGQKIYVDTRDISVAPSLMVHGNWEPEITRVFRKYVKPNSIVFDIGANFGYFGIVAGTEIQKGEGRIHFFEANPVFQPLLFRSLSVNGLDKKSRINICAVSDKSSGNLTLSFLDDLWGSSSVVGNRNGVSIAGTKLEIKENISVKTLSIDDYCSKNNIKSVDVIKIDIEGYEVEAYRGMKNTIKNSPDMKLFLEFTPHAYKDPEVFFRQILKDFTYVYIINTEETKLQRINSYTKINKESVSSWSMILASQKGPLHV